MILSKDEVHIRRGWYYLSTSIGTSILPGGLMTFSWDIARVGWKKRKPRGKRVREKWNKQFARYPKSTCDMSFPSPSLRKQRANLLWKADHHVLPHPHGHSILWGMQVSALTSVLLLSASSKGRISSAACKCPAPMKSSCQRRESTEQLPIPITCWCPRASLESSNCVNSGMYTNPVTQACMMNPSSQYPNAWNTRLGHRKARFKD